MTFLSSGGKNAETVKIDSGFFHLKLIGLRLNLKLKFMIKFKLKLKLMIKFQAKPVEEITLVRKTALFVKLK